MSGFFFALVVGLLFGGRDCRLEIAQGAAGARLLVVHDPAFLLYYLFFAPIHGLDESLTFSVFALHLYFGLVSPHVPFVFVWRATQLPFDTGSTLSLRLTSRARSNRFLSVLRLHIPLPLLPPLNLPPNYPPPLLSVRPPTSLNLRRPLRMHHPSSISPQHPRMLNV